MDSSGELLIVIGQMAIAWPFVARSLSAAFSSLDKKGTKRRAPWEHRPYKR